MSSADRKPEGKGQRAEGQGISENLCRKESSFTIQSASLSQVVRELLSNFVGMERGIRNRM